MRKLIAFGIVAAVLAGCGGAHEPQKKDEPMKVEDTAFGPLVGTPKKVEDRVNASQDQYRESLDQRLEQDEGGGPKDEEPSGD
jgi:hypothetical protein